MALCSPSEKKPVEKDVPLVGTTPPGFDLELSLSSQVTILDLIVFYNDDFGIVEEDGYLAHRAKARDFFFP